MYFYKGVVDRVVDGDTVEILYDLGFSIHIRQRVRLNGIDTAESRTSYELEDKAGELTKKYVKEQLEGKEVFIKSDKKGKFGRYLAEIYLNQDDKRSFNQYLVDEKLARPYFGKRKEDWTVNELNYIINKLGG